MAKTDPRIDAYIRKAQPFARPILVKAAAALNDTGVNVERKVRPKKPPVKAPPYFVAALKKNKKALEHYDKKTRLRRLPCPVVA